MATEAVADSSALLAVVFSEPGSDTVLAYRSMAVCAVNHCEVAGKMIGWGSDESAIAATLGLMAYGIHPFDDLRAVLAARLRNSVKARSLSFGDRACLSLAMVTGLPVLTADRDWSALDLGIDVRLIR